MTLETATPLSECALWKLQRRFYETQGKAAWANGLLPYRITSNPFIAEVYARLIESFLDDCRQPLWRAGECLRIVELGAGHGVFSYTLLKELERNGSLSGVRYLMTDASSSNVTEWTANTRFQPYVDRGILAFAQWVVGDSSVNGLPNLWQSDPDNAGPLVVIANYVFDSIPQDIYSVEQGELHEMHVTVKADSNINIDPKPRPDEVVPSLRLTYSPVEVRANRYANPLFHQLLNSYKNALPAATLLFPAVALSTIASLQTLSNGKLLVLSADKGYIDRWDLEHSPRTPVIEYHAGDAFSLMVNYDAMAKYCECSGGRAFLPARRPLALAVCAFAWDRDGGSFAGLQRAYRDSVGTFGPDDLHFVLEGLPGAGGLSLAQILAMIRLSRHSAPVLLRLADALLPLLEGITDVERDELRNAILETWDRALPLGPPEEDLAYRCGTLLLRLGCYVDSVALLRASAEQYGPAPATAYNLGLGYLAMDREDLALPALREASELDPAFEEPRTKLMELEARKLHIASSGFVVLRTPLLPVDEFFGFSDSLRAHQAWETGAPSAVIEQAWRTDVQALRARLHAILSRPDILQALFVASPSLEASIDYWRRDPDSKKGLQTERALVRYFARMSGRATPFGLFSGCSVGQTATATDAETKLQLQSREHYRAVSRLDFDYLWSLTASLRHDPAISQELRYWPNSSLHRTGDHWHYVECRIEGKKRSHHLVRLYGDPYVDAALERARNGAAMRELVEAVLLQPDSHEIAAEEATAYVRELIDSEVLVSTLSPLVTGEPPLDDIIAQLESLPSGSTHATVLRRVREQMVALDAKGLNSPPADYRAIAAMLESLPAAVDPALLFQVDMIKPVQKAVIDGRVIEELVNGVKTLCRMGELGEWSELQTFRDAFVARYEHAWVPLLQALDEEAGVGFGPPSGSDSSPLVRGLPMGGKPEQDWTGFGKLHGLLLRKVVECARQGANELVLEDSDLPVREDALKALPDAFDLNVTLAARSLEAVRAGDFQLAITGAAGPSGGRLLGRFCHADSELQGHVRDHLRKEEAHNPDAVYAEIVYLPEGRIGNVLCRPVLRDYEIVYLGRSGAPPDRQLPVSELLVTVTDDKRILLYSQRLQRRVIPRLTNAHGFMNPRLAMVYRFLCYLQNQQGKAVPGFNWGPLEALESLPRVRIGRVVLACARWRLTPEETKDLAKKERLECFLAMQELRRRRGLPRWVVLMDSDNTLPVDLENPLSVEAFVHVLKRTQKAILQEMYPPPDEYCVTGPEGRFQHELLVPFVKRPQTVERPEAGPMQPEEIMTMAELHVTNEVRRLPPGSEWLYIKLYGGVAAADDVLATVLPSLLETAFARALISRWFFIRYSDPHHHLRIRLQKAPDRLTGELVPLVTGALEPLMGPGRIWKVQFDTYDREIERYGGVEGMLASEDIFFADSDAVLEILRALDGDEGLDMRWRIALLGVDRLLGDCGLDIEGRRALAGRSRDSLQREFQAGVQARKQLGDRFRAERRQVEIMFENSSGDGTPIKVARASLERRSSRIAEAVRRLSSLMEAGKLHTPLSELAASYAHMHINRLIRSAQRTHELAIYDFLFRIYDGQLARRGREA